MIKLSNPIESFITNCASKILEFVNEYLILIIIGVGVLGFISLYLVMFSG